MARLGRRERARAKKRAQTQRSRVWYSAWGAGTDFAQLGRKKMAAFGRCTSPVLVGRKQSTPNVEENRLGPHSGEAGIKPGPASSLPMSPTTTPYRPSTRAIPEERPAGAACEHPAGPKVA